MKQPNRHRQTRPPTLHLEAVADSFLLALLCTFQQALAQQASSPSTAQLQLQCQAQHPSGYYFSAADSTCLPCPKGTYCPPGALSPTPCPPGTYQPLEQQQACLYCLEDHLCTGSGTFAAIPCPDGRTNPPGSASNCSSDCNNELYYLSTADNSCKRRTVVCNSETQYEVTTPLNRTQERVCRQLTVCKTVRIQPESPVLGRP